MTEGRAQERIEQLRRAINRHRYLYHVENKSEISDEARDSLMHELVILETGFPKLLTADSPSQRVAGKPAEGFTKVRHVVPQWSLADAFNEVEIRAFDERVRKMFASQKAPLAKVLGSSRSDSPSGEGPVARPDH